MCTSFPDTTLGQQDGSVGEGSYCQVRHQVWSQCPQGGRRINSHKCFPQNSTPTNVNKYRNLDTDIKKKKDKLSGRKTEFSLCIKQKQQRTKLRPRNNTVSVPRRKTCCESPVSLQQETPNKSSWREGLSGSLIKVLSFGDGKVMAARTCGSWSPYTHGQEAETMLVLTFFLFCSTPWSGAAHN